MKHVLKIVVVLGLVACLIWLMRENKVKQKPTLYTISKVYSFLQTQETFQVFAMINTEEHPVIKLEAIERVSLHDQDKQKSLSIHLKTVTLSHLESYLNETFQKVIYTFQMPDLTFDFQIEACYMTLYLKNGTSHTFYLGKIFIEKPYDQTFPYRFLEGLKSGDLSRISTIQIGLEFDDVEIISIGYHKNKPLEFEVSEQKIIVHIPKEAYILNDFPLYIVYSRKGVIHESMIEYHQYVEDFELLKYSTGMIYGYPLS